MKSSYLLLSLVIVACKSTASANPDSAAVVADASVAPTNPAAASNKDTEVHARALIESWVSAQNAATFSKYEELYAARFEGIRRSGDVVAKLDRARWMKERERMFKLKTTVSVKEITVTPTPDGAAVRFIQTWISDAYRDEGPKVMTLVRANEGVGKVGKLKIGREEMLASKMIDPNTALPELGYVFAIHPDVAGSAGAPTQLVLSVTDFDSLAVGPPKVASMNDPVITERALDSARLAKNITQWSGVTVELFGKSGAVCEGKVEKISGIGRVHPHFGTKNRWNGVGDSIGDPKPAPAIIAQEAWDLSGMPAGGGGGRLIVGDVKAATGDCRAALWGRVKKADAGTPPVLVEASTADPATKALAIAELRKTKAYAETQGRYMTEKEPKDPQKWEDFDAHMSVLMFPHPTLGTVVTVSVQAGSGCGTFGGTMSAAWIKNGAALSPLRDASAADFSPVSAGDVDGDGKIDLVEKEGLFRSHGDKLDAPIRLTFPDLDCGC